MTGKIGLSRAPLFPPPSSHIPDMPGTLPHLIPPFRYAIVEERLFRGGYPKPRNLRFLKRYALCTHWHSATIPHDFLLRLRLKTIVSLIPDPLLPEVQEFCAQQDITLLHFKVDKMREDNIPLSYSKTLMVLQVWIASSGMEHIVTIVE